MQILGRLATLAAILFVAACSGATSSFVPPLSAPQLRMHPNEGANALPGEGANALPGATLACTFNPAPGQGNCTIAINVTIPPISSSTTPASLVPGLHPSDLQNAYALPSSKGGTTVAIVDAYDDPTAEADLAVYRSTFGMPACTTQNGCFRKVSETGQGTSLPAVSTPWSDEIALDLDMVSASCPHCSILLVEANSASIDDLGRSVDEAVALGSKIVSNSYYAFEWPGETSEDAHYRHNGAAITVSAGDAAETFYPAASPYVTSVGGTTLSGTDDAWKESAWKFGGQGCSQYEKRPRFQNGISCKSRSIVDLAAIADPQTGVATYATSAGGWVVAGGTSVGAPLVAGSYALSGNPQGPAYSYAHRNAFHELGGAWYTLATGLGSPNGVAGL
ncbi:MAG: peptidase S8 [Candidatus Eremiobacteraeota bacterium]|nr:peptidase S8 [Candidatus Eremiobacteraeota bacterium]